MRELENVARKAILRSQGYAVSVEHLDPEMDRNAGPGLKSGARGTMTVGALVNSLLQQAERGDIEDVRARLQTEVDLEWLARAMDRAGGNLTQAARWLGLSRYTLRERLRELGLRPEP